jgi:glucokinase
MKAIGIDIGGTKITSALTDKGEVLKQYTFPTPCNQPKMKVVEAVCEAIGKVYDQNIDGIGIGVPGLVDLDNGLVLNVINIPSWDEVPLKQLVEDRFSKPVWINNDANCFTLGEKYFGKGQKYRNFVGITIGTGLGGGIIINDHLYSGKYCGAGEFGMLYYKNKTVEAYASGQFFKNLDLEGEDLSKRAANGDMEALRLFNLLGHHVGCAVANILFTLAPESIILGGSVTQSYRFFERSMRLVLEKEFPYQCIYKSLQIEISELQNSAVLGASSLVIDALI